MISVREKEVIKLQGPNFSLGIKDEDLRIGVIRKRRNLYSLRIKDEALRIRLVREGCNPHRVLVDNPPRHLTKKGDLAELVGLVHLLYPEVAYPKEVFPVTTDRQGITACLAEIIENKKGAGIATCYYNGQGTAPYWAGRTGVKTEEDIKLFFGGDRDNRWGLSEEERNKKYWWVPLGFTHLCCSSPSLKEIIVTSHQADYGQDSRRHFVARVRQVPDGSYYGELMPNTYSLRTLEEKLERKDLINFSAGVSFSGITPAFGASYQGREDFESLINLTKGFLSQVHNLLFGPVDFKSLFEVLAVYGLDTLELIGTDGRVKLYEVR